MKKQLTVLVNTMEAEMEFIVNGSTTGKQLFDQVVKNLGLREVWYFGLLFEDSKQTMNWVKLNKKLTQHDFPVQQPVHLLFRVKFYPEDAAEELIQEITIRLFYLQVKEMILNEEILAPFESAILLASYAAQAKYGSYDSNKHVKGFLANDRLVPQRLMEQSALSQDDWEESVMRWWKDHFGLNCEEAMLEYLKTSQDLEMYGVSYYEIKNRKGTDLLLGIDALGLNVYEKTDRVSAKLGFNWSEIKNIAFSEKKFVVRPVDKKSPDFVFYAPHIQQNKGILALCMGNHELYTRRRKPPSAEIVQLREARKDERSQRRVDLSAGIEAGEKAPSPDSPTARRRLEGERERIEVAEEQRDRLEAKVKLMEQDALEAKRQLHELELRTRQLGQQWTAAESRRHELDSNRDKEDNKRQELEQEAQTERQSRQRLEEAVKDLELMCNQQRQAVLEKDLELRRLQEELTTLRRMYEHRPGSQLGNTMNSPIGNGWSGSKELLGSNGVLEPQLTANKSVTVERYRSLESLSSGQNFRPSRERRIYIEAAQSLSDISLPPTADGPDRKLVESVSRTAIVTHQLAIWDANGTRTSTVRIGGPQLAALARAVESPEPAAEELVPPRQAVQSQTLPNAAASLRAASSDGSDFPPPPSDVLLPRNAYKVLPPFPGQRRSNPALSPTDTNSSSDSAELLSPQRVSYVAKAKAALLVDKPSTLAVGDRDAIIAAAVKVQYAELSSDTTDKSSPESPGINGTAKPNGLSAYQLPSKRSTLKNILRGQTKKRIDFFENL